jgi:hypothetical protein
VFSILLKAFLNSLCFVFIKKKNRRSVYGLKEEVDEHAFFSEPSGSMRRLSGSSLDDAWQLTPLTMNSSSSSTNSSKQRSLSSLHNEYSYLQLQSLCDHDIPKQQKQHQHNYLLGNDISNLGPIKMEKEEPQKTVHRFFDEWPPKNKESWFDLDNRSSNSASVSTTRLSISIPSSHDFLPIFNSRTNNGNQFQVFSGQYLFTFFFSGGFSFLNQIDTFFFFIHESYFVLQMLEFTSVGFLMY